jgi:hypothetical protein
MGNIIPISERISPREKALEECCGNYEDAIKLAQKETVRVEKELKASNKKLARLINLVENNAKNSRSILSQL